MSKKRRKKNERETKRTENIQILAIDEQMWEKIWIKITIFIEVNHKW